MFSPNLPSYSLWPLPLGLPSAITKTVNLHCLCNCPSSSCRLLLLPLYLLLKISSDPSVPSPRPLIILVTLRWFISSFSSPFWNWNGIPGVSHQYRVKGTITPSDLLAPLLLLQYTIQCALFAMRALAHTLLHLHELLNFFLNFSLLLACFFLPFMSLASFTSKGTLTSLILF